MHFLSFVFAKTDLKHNSKNNIAFRQQISNQKGQSFIEFMFLLMLVMSLSFGFLKMTNNYLANYWTSIVNIIVTDGMDKTGPVSLAE